MRTVIKKVKALIPLISFVLDSVERAMDLFDEMKNAKAETVKANPYEK